MDMLGAGIGLANGLGSGITSLLNAGNTDASSRGYSDSSSWGSSGSSAYNRADSWGWSDAAGASQSFADTNAENTSSGWSNGESSSWGNNWSTTYGQEATAKDIELAKEANRLQLDLWNRTNEFNVAQAKTDRDWQEYMANTAYQRAVLDLKAAGLNPILAVQGMGAATPVGAMATSTTPTLFKANSQADTYSYGNSGSRSYNRSQNKSYGYSKGHSESSSSNYAKSQNGSHSEGSSSSWSQEGSSSHSEQESSSKTRTQLRDLVDAVSGLMSNSGSAKTASGTKLPQSSKNVGIHSLTRSQTNSKYQNNPYMNGNGRIKSNK